MHINKAQMLHTITLAVNSSSLYPLLLNWISQASRGSIFARLGRSPFLWRILFPNILPGHYYATKVMTKSLISIINYIPESTEVSCWSCNASSTAAFAV